MVDEVCNESTVRPIFTAEHIWSFVSFQLQKSLFLDLHRGDISSHSCAHSLDPLSSENCASE